MSIHRQRSGILQWVSGSVMIFEVSPHAMWKTHNLFRGVAQGIPSISIDHLILWFLPSQQQTLTIIENTLS